MNKSRKPSPEPASARSAAGSGDRDPARRRRPRRRWRKLALAVLGPFLILGGCELGLRLTGYGYPTDFFISTRDGTGYTFNEQFRRQYYPRQRSVRGHPFRIDRRKPPRTTRIFVLGESAALGTPSPSFGFARILAVLLRDRYPKHNFEVINVAMRGINSHIIRDIADDCTRHEPDLFLVYAGNNEVVGFAAPERDSSLAAQNLALIRTTQALRRTRLAQLIEAGLESLRRKAPTEQGMGFFRQQRLALDDPRREAVCRNFRENLADMCAAMTAAGTPVLLSTVPVNLRDFPPVASLHRASWNEADKTEWERLYQQGQAAESAGQWRLAADAYQKAAAVDDHHAELHFRLGRCQLALSRGDEARAHFELARDWDALQFRADRRVNTLIRETAAQFHARGVQLVDAETAIAASPLSEGQLPGNRLFQDHVHPRFDGDYVLACTFYDAVVSILGPALEEPAGSPTPLPSRDDCARALAFTGWDELEVDTAMTDLLARPPFLDQAGHDDRVRQRRQELKGRQDRFQRRGLQPELEVYRQALERTPNDWELHHNLGMLLMTLGQPAEAIQHLEVEVRVFPELAWCRLPLGQALMKAGRLREAEVQLREALRIDGDVAPAKEMLAAIRRQPAR